MFISRIFLLLLVPSSSLRANEFKQLLNNDVLHDLNMRLQGLIHEQKLAAWNYETNLTDFNLQKKLKMDSKLASFQKEAMFNISRYQLNSITDINIHRECQLYLQLEEGILSPKKYRRLKQIVSEMITIYSTAKICDYNNPRKCDLLLQPDIEDIFSESPSEPELAYTWIERSNAVGPKCRNLFQEYVKFTNEAARMNGFADASEYHLREYTDSCIKEKLKHYNRRIRPLYEQLHAYVRFKLRKNYGNCISETGLLPAHLLGGVSAQKWGGVGIATLPYPETFEDLSENLKRQNYTLTDIARLAEDFQKSLNLTKMPDAFWKKSILTKSSDRPMTCHPSAWDFSDGRDFRLKACLKADREGFEALHHWMGHIQYFLQYQSLDIKMRSAASDALFDAVGGALSIAALSLKHLKRLGLFRGEIDQKADINNLYLLALSKIPEFRSTYVALSWKWKVLSGKITPENYNSRWWKLVEKYQGLKPPVPRSEKHFDPGNIYEIICGDSILK
nr:unnamed protein product [Callosobruchus chinensis]